MPNNSFNPIAAKTRLRVNGTLAPEAMKPVLRPAMDRDFEFASQAKKDAMGPHISAHWGWDETGEVAA